MKILLTGAFGQLGFFSRAVLEHVNKHTVIPAGRMQFAAPEELQKLVSNCDVIVHLAGVNRGNDCDVMEGNPALATALCEACRATGAAPDIVYSSSIHVHGDSIYGQSKRKAASILKDFCVKAGSVFSEIVFPNLFGEFSKPNYNNFTGTFCHQIANGEKPSVDNDAPVTLMHYTEAAEIIAGVIGASENSMIEPGGHATSVGAVAKKLQRFSADYSDGTIPQLADLFETRLFNAFRQVLYPGMFPATLVRHADTRGSFFECIREFSGGQTSFSTTVPGITRGDHFHFDKIERFLVLSGKARISIRKLYCDETINFDVTGDKPVFIDMPTMHTHNITNTGDTDLLTLFWTNDHYDPQHPDTYQVKV